MSSDYTVTIRGPVPADLARKLAEAHAEAIIKNSRKRVDLPGERSTQEGPDAAGHPHDL